MSDPLAVSWAQAAENHRRDALSMSYARRWAWLAQAMDLGFAVARSRASRGLVSVDANGVPFGVGGLEGAERRPGAAGVCAS